MDANTMRAWIAGYAAVVSTIALVWNIINSINQNKSKIEVSAYITASFNAIPGVAVVSKTTWNLTVDIVNHSKYKKYIEQPLLEFPKKIGGENRFKVTNFNNIIKYPQLLESEQKFETEMGLCESLLKMINNESNSNKKVRVVIKDTQGKEYYSKYLKLEDLKEKCELNLSESGSEGNFKRRNM